MCCVVLCCVCLKDVVSFPAVAPVEGCLWCVLRSFALYCLMLVFSCGGFACFVYIQYIYDDAHGVDGVFCELVEGIRRYLILFNAFS